MIFRALFVFGLFFMWGCPLSAQLSSHYTVATDRMLWHDQVDLQQQRLTQLLLQGKITKDRTIYMYVQKTFLQRTEELQKNIELDSSLSTNFKKKQLRSLEFLLKGYNDQVNHKDIPPSIAPGLIEAFENCVALDFRNESIFPVIQQASYGIGKILVECFLYPSENPGVGPSRIELVRKYCHLHPNETLQVLKANPDLYFADSLIALVARKNVAQLYDYAQANNALGLRIRNHKDPMVQLIASMAASKSGQLYFPFLESLRRGELSLHDIDAAKDQDLSYFRLLVQTRIREVSRMFPPLRDTASSAKLLMDMMTQKAHDVFVNEINALHAEENEAIRFKKLDGLSPEELYYIAVLSDDVIYTSSFVKGVYPRIFQRMQHPQGDSLLMLVQGDHFRKFIKMCAGYNTLNDFLARQDKNNANILMKAFVLGLERTESIEQAVDVADSYSSIMDKTPVLATFIRGEVAKNLKNCIERGDSKGQAIYDILQVLFRSADTTSSTDLSNALGIPPVYSIDYNSLKDDSGRVSMQVFFYGDEDKDGQNSYASFMSMFRNNPAWRVSENPAWVHIVSVRGKPVNIFANKPLMGDDDPEEKAIDQLSAYLEKNHFSPTIFVHRGHSFHVASTMRRITSAARVVVLGSCGGYNNINEVLAISADAHIISSKQTGTMHVNEPILQSMQTRLMAGKNIDWIPMWRELSARFTTVDTKEKFDDYIPPFKNLGAIFIKAYNAKMENE